MKPLEERNLAAAGAEFTAALARNARDTTALYYMGRIVMAEERSGEAVDWFEKAVKVDDNSSEYHLWLANALGQEAQRASKLRQPFLAVRVKGEFECAVQLDPRGVVARRGLMDFYMIARRHGGSKEMLDRLLAAKPGDVRAHYQVRRAAALSGKQLERGEQSLKLWMARPPEDATTTSGSGAHYRLGMIYDKEGRRDLARAQYEEALRINPRNDEARKSLEQLKRGS